MRTPTVILLSVLSAAFPSSALYGENLIAFVGKKISVTEFEPKTDPSVILMDSAFKARYQVIDVVFGRYPKETIQFEAYDHYGRPPFENYEHVLLFVSGDDGTFYHQKYQYFPVFKTKAGVWAGCGDPYQFEPAIHRGDLKARALDFEADAYLDISKIGRRLRREYFSNDNFEIRGAKAYCKKGNTVQELFEVKKQGVLRARGLFEDDANQSLKGDVPNGTRP